MRRRTFINYIGSAIIGTAIALRLPDGLVPLNHLTERPRISFQMLLDAYNKARESGDGIPYLVILGTQSLRDASEAASVYMRTAYTPARPDDEYSPYFHFMDTVVTDDPETPDDVIQVHSRNGVIKEYYFA